jgi:hypothetical protein
VKTDWKEYPSFRAAGSEKVAVITEDARELNCNVFEEDWSVEEGQMTGNVTVQVTSAESNDEEADNENTETWIPVTWIPVRESDIDSENGTWTFDVYNYPHDLPDLDESGYPQCNAGIKKPRLRGRSLRVRLAKYYIRYLMQARYLDFTTVPHRFLEECLIPDRILESPWIKRSNFRLKEDLDLRNSIPSALRQLRNRASHGHTSPLSGSEEEYRKVSLLLMMLLLDFIEREEAECLPQENYVDQLRGALNSRYDQIDKLRDDLEPENLVSDTEVEWLHAAVFIVCYYTEELIEGEKVLLSAETTRAIRKMADLLLELKKGEVTACLPDRINIAVRSGGLAMTREQDCITPFHDLSEGDVVRFRQESGAEEFDVAKDVWRI